MSSHLVTSGFGSLQGLRGRRRPHRGREASATGPSRNPAEWFVITVMVLLAALVIGNLVSSGARSAPPFPQSAAMEDRLGVRFSRVAVVGDGGLITLSYVVLDQEKATVFQSDVAHPPVLRSEARNASTTRVSLMKQGHTLRPGQTFYLVYENTAAALRPGEEVTIDIGGLTLPHVPVL
ncbi:MAG: hypothetical protein ACYCTH_05900 [Cellulomonas sp.]